MDQEKDEKILLVFRGAPGAGKMTFVKQNQYLDYTECTDLIRIKFNFPRRYRFFDHRSESHIWDCFWANMRRRALTDKLIIACNTASNLLEIEEYIPFAKENGFKMYIVDFTNVLIEVCKKQNKMKQKKYMRVPDSVIDKMFRNIERDKVPDNIDVITPEQAKEMVDTFLKRGLN